jgi:hydrogenase maturation protease
MKTLVLGLGNSILRDDGVGLRVAAGIKAAYNRPEVKTLETESGGINLLDWLVGYDRAIIIDAIRTPQGKPGQIYQLRPGSLYGTLHTDSTHGLDFVSVLDLGRKLGLAMPREITIFAIEAQDVNTFGEDCSQEVRLAIPTCIEKVVRFIKDNSDPES